MTQQQRTVLLIDCCYETRKAYRQYLLEDREFIYTIFEAESGQGGLAACQNLSLDSILLEYQLPDLNGLELLAQLQTKLNGSCPPVVMVTDRGSEAIAVKALKSGAEDYLVKGQVTADEVRLAVHSAIANAQLRRKLQEGEQRFKTSVENLLDCFGIYTSIRDESGQIVDFQVEYVNPIACEDNCMTQEQQVGKRLCELFPVHPSSELFEEYCRVVETGEPLMKESLEYTDVFGDRRLTKAYDIRISKLNDGFVAAWRDVTARKQVEIEREQLLAQEQQIREAAERNKQQYRLLAAKLRESDRRFRAIFNATFQLIGSLSPEGILLEVNQTALDFVGVTKEEVIDRPFWETKWWTISPQTQARLREAIEQAATTGEFLRYEVDILDASNKVATVDFSLKPVFDETGQVVLLIPEGRDISDKKQAEAALRQSETLFRGVFESDLIGILFWNIEGQITDANDNFCRMIGYSRAEIQAGQVNYNDITPAQYRESDAQKFEILQTTGKYTPFEKEYIRKDGSRIPILLGCAFLPGYSDRGVAFVLDISEKKQWEREREALLAREQEAREQAETANRNKDEFLAIVSHELRSPLNSILGWAKLLRTRQYDPTIANRALETIERNAQAQSQLIEDLLDISRMIRGTLRLNLAPVNLITIVESTVTSLALAAKAKNINLEFQIPNSSFIVSGDLYRLQQIVTNLLTNAIKFTPNGGRVEILLQRVEGGQAEVGSRSAEVRSVSRNTHHYAANVAQVGESPAASPRTTLLPTNNFAQLQVTDTGKGISADFLPYIFERFRQVDDPTIRSKNGLGLGLAIVRHLVELHGGTVTAASAGEGQGATFKVMLPRLETKEDKEDLGDKEDKEDLGDLPLKGVQVLVVDDDADTREFLHFALTSEGAVVKVATSAQEALEILNSFQPDAIVSDIGMPEEDGYSFLRQVRSQTAIRGEKQIPAIALTAFARESDRQQAMNAGFGHHLTKPVVLADLADAIVNLIQNTKCNL